MADIPSAVLPAQARGQGRRRGVAHWLHRYGAWYLFLAPNVAAFLVFNLFTWGFLLFLSFNDWSLIGERTWIGLANYQQLIKDPVMHASLRNTLQFVVMFVVPLAVVSLGLALLANRPSRAMQFFRAAYFLPVVTSISVLAIIWTWLFIPQPDGPINYLLGFLRIPPQDWLLNPDIALPSLTSMNLWTRVGYFMVLWLAGLQSVPEELYEAGKLDGAGRWALFWHITLPLLKPTTIFIVIIATIEAFQMFGPVYILTGGGPAYATITLVYYVWQSAFSHYVMGYSAAISVVLFLLILAVALIQRRYLGWGEDLY